MADSYGAEVNMPLLSFMSTLRGTVLDIGCGAGTWAGELRRAGAERLVGIEPSADARAAATRYDSVINDPIEGLADIEPVDFVIAADVIEHLVDPWKVLRRLHVLVRPGTMLYVSVPNIQFVKAWGTIVRGDFPAEDGGFWDRTHLHWFTAGSLRRELAVAGWMPQEERFVTGGGKRGSADRLTRHRLGRYLGHQVMVSARSCPRALGARAEE